VTYEDEILRIASRMDTAGPRLRGLFGNLTRALNRFADARPAGVTSDERGALLAFEVLLIEALEATAALLNGRGDHGGARECLDLVESVRAVVQNAIDRTV
jgi:hypothetical protein